jgi:hypothetical protein
MHSPRWRLADKHQIEEATAAMSLMVSDIAESLLIVAEAVLELPATPANRAHN